MYWKIFPLIKTLWFPEMKYTSCPRHQLPYKTNVGRNSVFSVRQHLALKSFIKRKFLPAGQIQKSSEHLLVNFQKGFTTKQTFQNWNEFLCWKTSSDLELSTQKLDLRKLLIKMSNVPYFKKSSKILESQTVQRPLVAGLGLTKRALRTVGKGRQALQDSGRELWM